MILNQIRFQKKTRTQDFIEYQKIYQGIVGCTPTNVPYGKSLYKAYIVGIYGLVIIDHPRESLENTINIMGTLLGVHPIVPGIYSDIFYKTEKNISPQLDSYPKKLKKHAKFWDFRVPTLPSNHPTFARDPGFESFCSNH